MHSIPDNVRGENVCDLETYMGDWNWQLLQSWIPYGILDKMSNIKPPNRCLETDNFVLEGMQHDDGSVK